MIFLHLPEPAEIDGEPEHVVEVVKAGLGETAATMGDFTAAAFVQLRAAGVADFDSVEEWEDSAAGLAAADVKRHAIAFVAAVRRLQALN